MGPFAVYTFTAGVFLLSGYLVYKWLLSAENQPAFNRLALLGIYVVAFILPLCHFGSRMSALPADMVDVGIAGLTPMAAVTEVQSNTVSKILLWIYVAGMVVVGCTTLYSLLRLVRLIGGGERINIGDGVLVRIDRGDIAPFSWGRYIVVSDSEDTETLDLIVRHERAHIRLGHFYDLILAQVVCVVQWYNPAAWLMLSELKAVHEYQADRAVIEAGTNIRQYQILLIKKTVGVRFQSFANSLNHSNLKKRITMMYETKTKPVRRFRALAAVPAAALALALLNVPSISGAMTEMSSTRLTDKVSGFSAEPQAKDDPKIAVVTVNSDPVVDENGKGEAPEVLPKYPGGEAELMKALCYIVRYPEEAYKAKIQGQVVVGFTVGADGSISDYKVIKSVDPQLDAEALRSVKALNVKWVPAQKNGKPVNCAFALPITFKLK